ncbi:hypothetical protein FQR65_LT17616 [Abscondita terminalis]|nr:hypothetical protein FQR65_LT17616 [Abscondita terminalis]
MKRTETYNSVPTSSESISNYVNSQCSNDSNSAILNTNTPRIHRIRNLTSDHVRPRTPSSTSTLSSVLDTDRILLGQMQTTIAAVAEQVMILNHKIDALLSNSQLNCSDTNLITTDLSLLGHLSLQIIYDFNSFEEKLQDDNFCNKVIKVLISVGGSDLRSCIGNMMRRLMFDSLGEKNR